MDLIKVDSVKPNFMLESGNVKKIPPTQKQPMTNLKTLPKSTNRFCVLKSRVPEASQTEVGVLCLAHHEARFEGFYNLGLVRKLLRSCANASILKYGKSLHGEAIKTGVHVDVAIGTSLIAMYSKSGFLLDARKVFDYMPERNVKTWNAMIGGYTKVGDMEAASTLFYKMSEKDQVTWAEMIDGFGKRGDLDTARSMFDRVPVKFKDVTTWTVMVDGYARRGEMTVARLLFDEMPERNAFAWSSMITGYCNIGDLKGARDIFDRVPVGNLVVWNSFVCGCAKSGFCEEALEAFGKMDAEGLEPDEVTLVGVLSACAQLGLLDVGKKVHRMISEKGMKFNQFIVSALVNMYTKCGDLTNARAIFEGCANKNHVCWNAMISGFAIHGQSKEALKYFKKMENSKKPNEVTFLTVLSACAHGGLVDEGLEIFSSMEKYGLAANIRHYGCVVDLLGRAGRVQDAYDFIKRMPMKPNDTIWGAFLGACRIHSEEEMMERMREEFGIPVVTDLGNDPHYTLLSNVYAAADNWEKAERMRTALLNQGLRKTAGHSSVILPNESNSFIPAQNNRHCDMYDM